MISQPPKLKGESQKDFKMFHSYLIKLVQELEYSLQHIDVQNITYEGKNQNNTDLLAYIEGLQQELTSMIAFLIAYINNVIGSLPDYSYINEAVQALNQSVYNINVAISNLEDVDVLIIDQLQLINDSITELNSKFQNISTVEPIPSMLTDIENLKNGMVQVSFKRYNSFPTTQQIINDGIQVGEIILVRGY